MWTIILVWTKFAAGTAIIGIAGWFLSKYGDEIGDRTGLGGTWIGVVLLATVTSLPELITALSAVTIAHVPEIAMGNILGSCVFNLVLIMILDFLQRGESIYKRASQGHILSAAFGVVLIGFVGFNILLGKRHLLPPIFHMGMESPIIVALYLLAMRTVFRHEGLRDILPPQEKKEEAPERPGSLKRAIVGYVIASLVVVAAGLYMPFMAEDIAATMHWRDSFVGTLFVAFATSVPEIAVTMAALRLGAVDLAIGNVLGSNLFNIAIVPLADVVYLSGPLLADVSEIHVFSAVSAMTMSGIAIVGLLYRPTTRIFKTVGWVSLFLFFIFLFNTYVSYIYAG